MGRPTMVCSTPRCLRCVEIDKPKGPAPTTITSVLAMKRFPHLIRAADRGSRCRLLTRVLPVLAPLLAVIPLLLDDPGRVPGLGQRGPHVAAVDEIIMTGAGEFRCENPQTAP